MDNLSLDAINPKEAELRQLATDFGALTIKGLDDKEGYTKVHDARMTLRSNRVEIEKTGKALREKTTAFNKAVIAKEKELIGIIEPLEERLHTMEKEIDEAIEMEKRRALLPARREKVLAIECVISDADLLKMTPETFDAWYNENRTLFLDRKEAALKADEERVAKEKLENERKAIWPSRLECLNATGCDCDHTKLEQAMLGYSTEAFDQFLKDHTATWEEIKRGRDEAEERGRQKAQQEAKEKEEREAREAKEAEERAAKEQAELEGKKKFKTFLTKHGVTEAFPTYVNSDAKTPPESIIAKNGNRYSVYKLVESITL